jgi:predicted DNA-binding ArsR family transcriptional regulator
MYLSHFFIQKLQNLSNIILELCKNEHQQNVEFEEILPILQNINTSFIDLKEQLETLNEAILNGTTKELSTTIINQKAELYKNLVFYYYFVVAFGLGIYCQTPPLD